MRLIQLKVSNFRCYEGETAIDLDDLVVLVGKNDAGKSSLFDALDIFFEGKSAPDRDDKCVRAHSDEVRIACVFDNLPAELVIDAQRPTDLASEYLLNDERHLEIVKVYDCGLAKPKCSGVYAHAVHPTADDYADLLSLTNAKLKQRANALGVDVSGVNQSINTELRRAIWAQAGDLRQQEVDIELKAEAAKAIWDQVKKHLPVFALFKSDRPSTDQDAEAQDPMKAAVREAINAQEDALNDIASKVRADVQQIADRTVEKLAEMSPELARQLTPRVSNKSWDTLFSVSLTGDEDIPINKRGSGSRRLVLLNFFRAKAEGEAEERDAGLIYAIEEPETSQHPHNQVMLVKAIEDLAERPGCQVFVTTHTPMLARRFPQRTLRLVATDAARPVIRLGESQDTINEIVSSLGVLPDHNIKVFFGVEGRNDISFLRVISKMLHEAGEHIPDLGAAEDAGHLVFVPLGGSNLDLWVSRLEGFDRHEFYLMDRDTPPPAEPHYKVFADKVTQRECCEAWHTNKRELENYVHRDLITNVFANYEGNGDDFEDAPELLAKAAHEAVAGKSTWDDVKRDPQKMSRKVSKAKKRLCNEFASRMTPELLTEVDPADEVRGWLKRVGEALDTGKNPRKGKAA